MEPMSLDELAEWRERARVRTEPPPKSNSRKK
ncbi:MAG: GpE family phage tail protein [Pseudohongiella sp.]|nr:GpE family phage tail protein [Pseudohongiella sp.]